MRFRTVIILSLAAAAGILIKSPKLREQIKIDIEDYGKVVSDAIVEGRQTAISKEKELLKDIETKKQS